MRCAIWHAESVYEQMRNLTPNLIASMPVRTYRHMRAYTRARTRRAPCTACSAAAACAACAHCHAVGHQLTHPCAPMRTLQLPPLPHTACRRRPEHAILYGSDPGTRMAWLMAGMGDGQTRIYCHMHTDWLRIHCMSASTYEDGGCLETSTACISSDPGLCPWPRMSSPFHGVMVELPARALVIPFPS